MQVLYPPFQVPYCKGRLLMAASGVNRHHYRSVAVVIAVLSEAGINAHTATAMAHRHDSHR
ncbi:hypothetical protein BW716_23115 [[Flexibacter] sp. ATCC 35208]|nr:hypothetical protein BW716_23115 [[Flexibacter] sp. ATCC 35208]